AIEVVLELVFVCEAIDALECWMCGADVRGYERIPGVFRIRTQPAEDALGAFPQHLHEVVSATCVGQGGCIHRSGSRLLRRTATRRQLIRVASTSGLQR